MSENQQFVPPVNTQINPPELPSKKPVLLIILLFLLLLIAIGVVFFLLTPKTNVSPKTTNTPTPLPTTATVSATTVSPSVQQENHLLIYLRDGNLWSVKLDGTSLRQLTRDADPQSFNYTLPVIKTNDEITFGQCFHLQYECTLKSKNLETGNEKNELAPKSYISVFTWDKNASLLAFVASQKEGTSSLYFYESGNNKKVLDFASSLGRGGGLGDEVSLNFSPDGKFLLVVNTTTQPNASKDTTTLWLINRSGNLISKKEATNAVWENNTSFLYKKGASLYRNNLSGQEEKLADISGYNFTLSPDSKKLLYWNANDDGTTAVSLYDLNTKITQEVKKDLGYPKWVNDREIMAIKTSANPDSYFGFSTNGLIVFNLETKEEHLLDSNSSISQFIIQQLL